MTKRNQFVGMLLGKHKPKRDHVPIWDGDVYNGFFDGVGITIHNGTGKTLYFYQKWRRR